MDLYLQSTIHLQGVVLNYLEWQLYILKADGTHVTTALKRFGLIRRCGV
jgi:hypothetical protein